MSPSFKRGNDANSMWDAVGWQADCSISGNCVSIHRRTKGALERTSARRFGLILLQVSPCHSHLLFNHEKHGSLCYVSVRWVHIRWLKRWRRCRVFLSFLFVFFDTHAAGCWRHLRAHGLAWPRRQEGNGRQFRRKLSEKLSEQLRMMTCQCYLCLSQQPEPKTQIKHRPCSRGGSLNGWTNSGWMQMSLRPDWRALKKLRLTAAEGKTL